MNKPIEIIVPRETVNDDTVTIIEWNFGSGDAVKEGDLLLTIETSKAAIEIQALANGYLQVLSPLGSQVEVGARIGKLHGSRSLALTNSSSENLKARSQASGGTRITKLAAEMIRQNEIEVEVFEGKGLIRRADVQNYLDEAEARKKESIPEKKEEVVLEAVDTAPQSGFFSDAKNSAKDRGRNIFWLGLNYFFRNYLLGHFARMAPLGLGLLIHRLRGVKIGKGVYIDPSATIETAYPENITIGDDVRVTANAIIMTHIKAPHHLRNTGIMPMVLKPVVLEESCFIGVNSVIMPGVTIGKAAVVGSGSTVLNDVEAYTMVAGNPAKLIRRFPKPQQSQQEGVLL